MLLNIFILQANSESSEISEIFQICIPGDIAMQ